MQLVQRINNTEAMDGERLTMPSSVTELALSCSKLTPSERISMRDAADELRKIRDRYLTDLSRANNL